MSDELAPYAIPCLEGLELSDGVGRGSFGVVYEVTVNGLPCIAKRLHDILINKRNVSQLERNAIAAKFRSECVLLSRLRHPNIVQFLGVHFGRDRYDLTLVMERMHMDLEAGLEKFPNVPLPFKIRILLDVSYGLMHLHSQSPPVVHRDFKTDNILLSPDFRAKVADLGMSKVLNLSPQQLSRQTRCPGAMAYMPPEALQPVPVYGVKLDVFSFGHVALYTTNQSFPESHELGERYTAAFNSGTVQLSKRKIAIDKMGTDHCLYQLIAACLHDSPEQRPTTAQLNSLLQELSAQHPLEDSPTLTSQQQQQRGEDLRKWEGELALREEKLRQREEEMQELRTQLEAAQSNVERLREHNRKKISEFAYVEEKLSQTELLNRDLSTKLEALEQELEQQRDKEERARKEKDALHDSYRKTAIDLEKKTEEVKVFMEQLNNLQSQVEVSQVQANVFEEDFKHEREDRTKAVSRHEEEVQRLKLQLEEQLVHAKDKARDQELVVKMLHDSMQKAQVSVEVAQEEVQVKTTQIKQYKKQVDTLKEKIAEHEKHSVSLSQEMMKVRGKLEKTMSVKGKLEKTKSTPGKLTGSAESITEKYYKLEVDFYAALKEITELREELNKRTMAYKGLHRKLHNQVDRQFTSTDMSDDIPSQVRDHEEPPTPDPITRANMPTAYCHERRTHEHSSPHESTPPHVDSISLRARCPTPSQPHHAPALPPQTTPAWPQQPAISSTCPLERGPSRPKQPSEGTHVSVTSPNRRSLPEPVVVYHQPQFERRQSYSLPVQNYSSYNPYEQVSLSGCGDNFPQGQQRHPQRGILLDLSEHMEGGMVSSHEADEPAQSVGAKDIPLDPNLVCPKCRVTFRLGEIQQFRRHVNLCK